MNRQNDKWLFLDITNVPTLMHAKLTSSVMALGVVSNVDFCHEIPLPPTGFLEKCPHLHRYAGHGSQTLNCENSHMFSSRSLLPIWPTWQNLHDQRYSQDEEFHSAHFNPLYTYSSGFLKREMNQWPHNIKEVLKIAIVDVMINEKHLTGMQSLPRLRAVLFNNLYLFSQAEHTYISSPGIPLNIFVFLIIYFQLPDTIL